MRTQSKLYTGRAQFVRVASQMARGGMSVLTRNKYKYNDMAGAKVLSYERRHMPDSGAPAKMHGTHSKTYGNGNHVNNNLAKAKLWSSPVVLSTMHRTQLKSQTHRRSTTEHIRSLCTSRLRLPDLQVLKDRRHALLMLLNPHDILTNCGSSL